MIPIFEKDFDVVHLQDDYAYSFRMVEHGNHWGMLCPNDMLGVMYSPITIDRGRSGRINVRVPHRMAFFQDVNFFNGEKIKDIYDSKI